MISNRAKKRLRNLAIAKSKAAKKDRRPEDDPNYYNPTDEFSWRFGFVPGKDRHWYMILHGGDVAKRIVQQLHADKEFQSKNEGYLEVLDIDGVPHTVCKVRLAFKEAVLKTRKISQLFGLLNQHLTEGDIKWIFPEIWRRYHNLKAKKAQRRSYNEYRAAVNRGEAAPKPEYTPHGETVRAAARHYGML